MGTRRRFIRDCSALAVSAALAPATMAAPRPPPLLLPASSGLAFAVWTAHIHSPFFLRNEKGELQSIELIEAAMASARSGLGRADQGSETFSLIFRGQSSQPLGQDTYSFEHPAIGRFAMFIVPIGCQDSAHCYYEAVFNRPSQAAIQRALAES